MSKRNKSKTPKKPATKEQTPKKREAVGLSRKLVLTLVLGVTIIGFGNTIFNGLDYDDNTQILESELIRNFANLKKALVTDVWFWRAEQDKDPLKEAGPSTPYYRPIFIIYLMIGWHLFGTWAAGWHMANILVQLLAVYLAFLLIERISKDYRLAGLASLIFAIHPLRSESVAWISGVTDPLLAVLLLSSFYLFLKYREERKGKFYVWSLVLSAFASFSKEPAACLPMMVMAYELFLANQDKPFRVRWQISVQHFSGFALISASYFLMRQRALGFVLSDPHFSPHSPVHAVLTIPIAIWKYIALWIWPADLSLFHYTPLVTSVLSFRFILPFIALVALVAALAPLWKSRLTRFALIWSVINLLPVLNLSAFSEDHLIQERYIYVPSIGFSMLVAIGLMKLPQLKWSSATLRRTAVTASIVVLCLVLTGKTMAQNEVWRDDTSLWSHGTEVAPDERAPHFILGFHELKLEHYDLAAQQFEQYLKLKPNSVIVLSNLAAINLFKYQNQAAVNRSGADRALLDRAIALSEKGLALASLGPLWDTLGTCYTFDTDFKNLDRALACYQRGLLEEPDNAMLVFHTGATYLKKGDYDQSLRYLQTARDRQPNLADVYKMIAYAEQGKGQIQAAIDDFNRYLQLRPEALDAPKVAEDIKSLRAQLQQANGQS